MSQKNVKLSESASSTPQSFTIKNLLQKQAEEDSKRPKSFTKEPEFTNCSTCGIEFGKILDTQKFCKYCHMAVCEKCSMEKVDNKRICDLCYVKFQEPKQEIRKDEFLEISKIKIESLKKKIKEGEKEIEELEKEAIKLHSPDSEIIKLNETLESLEEEKKQKIDLRNRALKDYEIFYSEFEEIKEKEASLNDDLKKVLDEQAKLIMSIDYLKQQNLYKDQEFGKLIDEQGNLKNSIKELKEGKSVYSRNSETISEERDTGIDKKDGEKKDAKKKGTKEEKKEDEVVEDENRCKFC